MQSVVQGLEEPTPESDRACRHIMGNSANSYSSDYKSFDTQHHEILLSCLEQLEKFLGYVVHEQIVIKVRATAPEILSDEEN